MLGLLAQQLPRIGHPILGVIVPALIFTISFFVAFLLYKHFTKKMDESKE